MVVWRFQRSCYAAQRPDSPKIRKDIFSRCGRTELLFAEPILRRRKNCQAMRKNRLKGDRRKFCVKAE